ncbi:YopX family protein [Leuconostoc gasicomitatum]|uniref:YopX family protein n=1 Tax=Leuconostoc gasicomitatum TaxID=115778 RepID=UPI001CC378A4|nr:YopX family protein [Leuconostoc gasicomitatum]MBZ5958162.1 hypothetical protein [Leuconostoc gasicomitatum]
MARDIKFREWDEVRERLYGSGLSYGEREDYDDSIGFRFLHQEQETENRVIEQFTCLKDTNGVDIYENDIVKFKDDHFGDNKSHYGIVEYSEYAELVIGNIMLSRVFQAVEVIGNIHKNPELLEEK